MTATDMTNCDAACDECGGFVKSLDVPTPICMGCGSLQEVVR